MADFEIDERVDITDVVCPMTFVKAKRHEILAGLAYKIEHVDEYSKEYEMNYDIEFDITCFSSGNDLLQTINKTPCFQILFLDVEMPGLSGIETAARVREIDMEDKCIHIAQLYRLEERIVSVCLLVISSVLSFSILI